VRKAWTELNPEHQIFFAGIRAQVRGAMKAMLHDGLDPQKEMSRIQEDMQLTLSRCFYVTAMHLELGNRGVLRMGSIGRKYVWGGEEHTWWLYGNGAGKSCKVESGLGERQLREKRELVRGSNGKEYSL